MTPTDTEPIQHFCTGCRYVFPIEWFGYREDKPPGTRFTTCINCRNRGRKVLGRRKTPLDVTRVEAARVPCVPVVATDDTVTAAATIDPKTPVSSNRPSTRSSTGKLPTPSLTEIPDEPPTTPTSPHIADTYGPSESSCHGLPDDSVTIDMEATPAPSTSPLLSTNLEIVFGSAHHPASPGIGVEYFRSLYPPSFEIFLVMLQIRYETLWEEDIRRVYVEDNGRLILFVDGQGGVDTWDVVMNILFKTAVSAKVYVEAGRQGKTYCACITRSGG